ncbi:tail fiber domain-containing protein [Rahnella variigena]|uniref:tail fiber domain-containing protein n=1 Tax=Rahnella variigena TaxID=574964 RepID=UPI0013308EC4|nr:tail fiber domain-containing protein [Rahnella variigena]
MSAGTIALTNNSANVTGTGTAFTTDLKAGDFVVVIVGGVTYTLGVKAITSATALTLVTAYGGPTATGNAWTAVPNATLVGITSQVAADVAKAIRGLNLDKANWQQVFSGTGTITVTLPDGSTYNGPSWSSLSTSLAGKADATTVNGKAAKGANSDITSMAGLTTALSIEQGGTGAKTYLQALNNLGAYPAAGGTINGNISVTGTFIMVTGSSGFSSMSFRHPGSQDKIMAQMFTENYGDIVFQTSVATNQPLYYFSMRQNGNFTVPANITCTSLTQTSDATKKKQIEPIENALSKIKKIEGVTFLWKESGMPSAGIIAQQLMEVLPESVSSVFDDNNEYGEVDVEETDQETGEKKTEKVRTLIRERDDSLRSYSVEYSGVVALAVQAIKELSEKVSALEAYIGPENLAAMSNEPTS